MSLIWQALAWLSWILGPARRRPPAWQPPALGGPALAVAERTQSAAPFKRGWFVTLCRWLLHGLIVALILVGLYFVNRWLQLERVLRSDWPFLHAFWLPLLFLLVYAMAWLAWWIWELTGPEKLTHDFPDIDHAWQEGIANLFDASVDLREVPLFLVLGRPLEGEDNVFLAAQFGFRVREVPRWPQAPLRFTASQEAVFLTCPGASVLAKHIALLIEEIRDAMSYQQAAAGAVGDVLPEAGAELPFSAVAQTEAPTVAGIQQVLGDAQQQGRGPNQLTDEEQRVISLLVTEEQASQPAAQSRRRVFLKSRTQVDEAKARLQHLCQLIVRHRRPYCPINGILVLLPFACTDSDEDASQATSACELDLHVIRDITQVQCPVFVLGCDAEQSPGFRELLQRMPASQRERRLGQRFPLVPDLEPGGVPAMVQEGVSWFSYTFLPALIYNLFRLGPPGNEQPQGELPEALVGNMRLYQFLSEVGQRRKCWTRFLTRGLLLDVPKAFLFGGFYLAGTGPDTQHDQAFVHGVFQRLPESQNFVSWTPEALAQENDYKRWTRYGYVLLLVVIAVVGGLMYRWWIH